MSWDHLMPYIALAVSFLALVIAYLQYRGNIRQQRVQSAIQIFDANRQILSMGVSRPELFKFLLDKHVEPVIERRYLQLWINQFAQMPPYSAEFRVNREMK